MKQDQLAPLLLSLTSAEKKYFVQFSQLRSDDKSYMKLYDCVLRDGKFNADKLSKVLKKTKANLAHEKEYLIGAILKSLRNYHDDMPEAEVYNRLCETALLNEKGLFELSKIQNSKALSLAEKQSRFETNWRAQYNRESITYRTADLRTYMNTRKSIADNLVKNVHHLKTLTDLYILNYEVDKLYVVSPLNRTEEASRKTRQLLRNRLLKTKFTEPLFTGIQLEILSNLYQMERNKKKSFACADEALKLIEKYPHRLQTTSNTYFLAVNSYLTEFISVTAATDFKGFEKFMRGLKQRYRKLPVDQHYLDNMFQSQSYVYYLIFYFRMVWRKTIPVATIKTFITNFDNDEPRLKKFLKNSNWESCVIRIGSLCFIMEDYDAALYWYRKILNQSTTKLDTDIVYKAKMAQLLIHAQLKDFSLLPHLIESTLRFLRQVSYLHKVERFTIALLHKVPNLISAADKTNAFEKYLAELRQIKAGDSIDKRSLHVVMYEEWALMNLGRRS